MVVVQNLAQGTTKVVANFRGNNSAPAWSPDGRFLAVALSKDGLTQIYRIPANGGPAERLTESSGIDTQPAYSPDGQTIAFTSDRGGSPQIYRMPAGGGNAERVTFSGSYNISPAVSPDGKTLAYIARSGNTFRLVVLDLASAGAQPQPITDTGDDEHPSFAPNGRLLIYATRIGGRSVLMTTTLDGKIKARLPSQTADLREPVWGPYGR
jgi:Periplasmic component of the Tol biopolymer transport system